MSWRKNSLMSALLLLVVALIGAVIWQRSEDSMARESSFQSSSMRTLYRYSKMTPNFGPEFAYRVSVSVPPGFSAQSRQLIGYLSRTYGVEMKALKVYGYRYNTQLRKYGDPTSLYSLSGPTVGLIRKSKADGWVPFVELSKPVYSKTHRKFAYVTNLESLNALKSWGYGEAKVLGYIKAPATKAKIPATKPAQKVQPQSLKNLIRYYRRLANVGTVFTYKTSGTSIPGWSGRKVIGYLYTQPGQDLKPLEVWARPGTYTSYKYGSKTTSYKKFVTTAGYCRTKPAEGFTALTQVRRSSIAYMRQFYAYAYDSDSLAALKRVGYRDPARVCFIKISN